MQTKRSLPPLTALRAFEAAARHKSFKLAAEELHVTPSAVSHAVAALEEFLGVKLFHRRVRRLLLTDAGGAYLAPLTRAFDVISTATREISARKRADLVTLASMPTFARVWLMPRLKAFLAAHSDVDLRVRAAVDSRRWWPRMSTPPSSTAGATGRVSSSTGLSRRGWCPCAARPSATAHRRCMRPPTSRATP